MNLYKIITRREIEKKIAIKKNVVLSSYSKT